MMISLIVIDNDVILASNLINLEEIKDQIIVVIMIDNSLLHQMPVFGFGCIFSSNGISFHHELMFAMGLEF